MSACSVIWTTWEAQLRPQLTRLEGTATVPAQGRLVLCARHEPRSYLEIFWFTLLSATECVSLLLCRHIFASSLATSLDTSSSPLAATSALAASSYLAASSSLAAPSSIFASSLATSLDTPSSPSVLAPSAAAAAVSLAAATSLSTKKERKHTQPKGGMGGWHAATTQGF